MKRYSSSEITKILDKVDYPTGLSIGQNFTVFWWTLIGSSKLNILCDAIVEGRMLKFAFKKAKEWK